MTSEFYILTRPQKLFVVCAGIFITALVVAEATASKLFTVVELPFTLSILGGEYSTVVMTAGVIAFPITFIVTDLLNEYYGVKGIRFVTLLGMAMIIFEFVIIYAARAVPTASISPVPAEAFEVVFGASGKIIIASLIAYVVGQFADISIFHWLRKKTNGKHLWLRATGSTFGSQFLDTFLVLFIAFGADLGFSQVVAITLFNYGYKFGIAILATPVIYGAHRLMDQYLGHGTAVDLIEHARAS